MTEHERQAQLKASDDEALRKLADDVAALRTAQLKTMQVVGGNTQIMGFILDRQDEMKQEFNARIDALHAELAEAKRTTDAQFGTVMQALRQLLHRQ